MLRLFVVGSGSVARGTALALSTVESARPIQVTMAWRDESAQPLRVTVAGRNEAALAELCTVAAMRAAGRSVGFTPVVLDPTDERALAPALAAAAPSAVLVCAATQSPWERLTAPSAWTDLVGRGGFGLTLPFQAQIALAVSRAVATACPGTPVVNACFPDAVNPLLAQAGAPVLAGVGNVGLLATAIQVRLALSDQSRLRLLGHHLHLHPPDDPAQEAVAELDGRPLDGVDALLAWVRAATGPGLNAVTGALAAQLLVDLATGATRDTHLPGVLGLPGGYPVRVHAGTVTLRLPHAAPAQYAHDRQREWSRLDGVLVEEGRVEFGAAAGTALAPLVPPLAAGFAVADLPAVTRELAGLRDRLRTLRAATGPAATGAEMDTESGR